MLRDFVSGDLNPYFVLNFRSNNPFAACYSGPSGLRKSYLACFTPSPLTHIFACPALSLCGFVRRTYPGLGMVQLSEVARGMATVLRVVPQFALGEGLMSMSFMQVNRAQRSSISVCRIGARPCTPTKRLPSSQP